MKEVIISSTLLDFEDSVVKQKVRALNEGETLVQFATRFAMNNLGHGCPMVGHCEDTDDENDGKVVDYGEDGVYFFFDDWVHKFDLLDNVKGDKE